MYESVITRQRELLWNLVQYTFEGKLKETIAPVPLDSGDYAIYLRREKSFKIKWISDLDALCDQGFMTFRWNRMSNGKLYCLTDAGIQAALAISNKNASRKKPQLVVEEDRTPGAMLKKVRKMNPALRQALAKALPASEFIGISRAIARVIQLLESPQSEMSQINELLVPLGKRLFSSFAACQTISTGKEVAKAIAIFGEWSEAAYRYIERMEEIQSGADAGTETTQYLPVKEGISASMLY